MENHIQNIVNVLYNAFVKLLENALSKKFLVFITCTTLLVYGYLPPELFITVALAVLGVQTALDWTKGSASLHPREYDGLAGPSLDDLDLGD